MTRNLADAWSWIDKLVRRVARLESGANLESSSITNGRMRFIGGLLRLDSGAILELIGQWRFFGNGAITGDVVAEGKWTQNGDWEFNGNGDIAGTLNISGPTQIDGATTINGNFWVNGYTRLANDLYVESDGRIVAGNVVITPSDNGGSIKFTTGPEVYAAGERLALYSGTGSFIELDSDRGRINGPGARWFEVNVDGFRFVNAPTISETDSGLTRGSMYMSPTGGVFRVVAG